MRKPGLVRVKMLNPLEALVPFAVVFVAAPKGFTRREAAERMLVSNGADAEAVLSRAGDNAPPQFRGWVCAADRPVPGWTYANSPWIVFAMAEEGYVRQQKAVVLDDVTAAGAFPSDGPPGGATLYAWPVVALYNVSVGRETPFWWEASAGLRMAVEEIVLKRLNVPPGCCHVLSAVVHRAAVPATNDFWTAEYLAKLGPKAIAEMQALPVPVSEKSHRQASWPLFLPVTQVVNHPVAVPVPGVTPEASTARRRLIEHGWKVAV